MSSVLINKSLTITISCSDGVNETAFIAGRGDEIAADEFIILMHSLLVLYGPARTVSIGRSFDQ